MTFTDGYSAVLCTYSGATVCDETSFVTLADAVTAVETLDADWQQVAGALVFDGADVPVLLFLEGVWYRVAAVEK